MFTDKCLQLLYTVAGKCKMLLNGIIYLAGIWSKSGLLYNIRARIQWTSWCGLHYVTYGNQTQGPL